MSREMHAIKIEVAFLWHCISLLGFCVLLFAAVNTLLTHKIKGWYLLCVSIDRRIASVNAKELAAHNKAFRMTDGMEVRRQVILRLWDYAARNDPSTKIAKCSSLHVRRSLLFFIAVFSFSTASAALQPDLDSDGIPDVDDIDQDNDGISNSLEGLFQLERLSSSPAVLFDARPIGELSYQGSSYTYHLTGTNSDQQINLAGKIVATNTDVDWSMHESLPKVRNLSAGSTRIEWSFGSGNTPYDIDMTVTDLDADRNETIAISAGSIVGYSLSINSNISVVQENGLVYFIGAGTGGESLDDAVTLHIRDTKKILVSYLSSAVDFGGGVSSGSADSNIAGFRHSFSQVYSFRQGLGYFYPLSQVRDSDADGVPDHRDLDSDNDGLGDVIEVGGIDSNGDNILDGGVNQHGMPLAANSSLNSVSVGPAYDGDVLIYGDDNDTDGLLSSVDNMPGQFGGSLAGIDTDGDGLLDLDEIRIHKTDPESSDTDGDTLTDLSELQVYLTDPLLSDTDNDGLSDSDEILVYDTMPLNADSDLDGLTDGAEIVAGTDPLLVIGRAISLPAIISNDAASATSVESINFSGDEPIISDDPIQHSSMASLHTGVSGTVGCSIMSSDPDPSLPLWLSIATFCLLVRKNNV